MAYRGCHVHYCWIKCGIWIRIYIHRSLCIQSLKLDTIFGSGPVPFIYSLFDLCVSNTCFYAPCVHGWLMSPILAVHILPQSLQGKLAVMELRRFSPLCFSHFVVHLACHTDTLKVILDPNGLTTTTTVNHVLDGILFKAISYVRQKCVFWRKSLNMKKNQKSTASIGRYLDLKLS